MDKKPTSGDDNSEPYEEIDGLRKHTTFAGSAFYISPEMFQRVYTALTDVWSVGVTLYVLVAGYPADNLQKAFNILQTADKSKRNLRSLPNMPSDMPDSYYDLLEQALTYRYRNRPTAGQLLKHEFVQFHKDLLDGGTAPSLSLEDVAAAAAQQPTEENGSGSRRTATVTASMSVRGSVVRHTLFLGFKQFERSVTTLLAAMLSKRELEQLLLLLQERSAAIMVKENGNNIIDDAPDDDENAKTKKETTYETKVVSNDDGNNNEMKDNDETTTGQKLSVVKIGELRGIIKHDLQNHVVLDTMSKIPNAQLYENFAYHTALLNDFTTNANINSNVASLSASLGGRKRVLRRMNSASNLRGLSNFTGSNGSERSASSLRGGRRFIGGGSRRGGGRNSVHGTAVFRNMAAAEASNSNANKSASGAMEM
jgi:serine/threonine protein kinase